MIKLLSWFLVIGINIYADRNGPVRNYLLVNIIRLMACILHGVLFDPQDIWDYLPVAAYQWSTYWLFFPLGLNIVTHKPLLYYDTKEKNSGWTDKFFAWAGPVAHAASKGVALGVLIWSLITIL